MGAESEHKWRHDHAFGQEQTRVGERRTFIVIAVTAVTMVVEIVSGIAFGSMALLADGLHMASHALALGIAAAAYVYTRRHAHDARYSFGSGKINALGGFVSALLLALFVVVMAVESVNRLFNPVDIIFNQAIAVAVLGLVVNGASLYILGGHHDGGGHAHGHSHGHDDHNLRAAYLHVMADALTSILAILALLSAKYFGWNWMDPIMGIVGAVLVATWSWGMVRDTSHVLLDRQAPARIRVAMRAAIEGRGASRVADLHVWSIGPNIYVAVITVVADEPKEPDHYKAMLPKDLGVVHTTVEVYRSSN